MSTARCRIPMGYFYGHMVVVPDEVSPEQAHELVHVATPDWDRQLSVLSKLFEDVSCRYSLACSKLKELLHPYLISDISNTSHLASYMQVKSGEKNGNFTNTEHAKIFAAYQVKCVPY